LRGERGKNDAEHAAGDVAPMMPSSFATWPAISNAASSEATIAAVSRAP
jgi:hypothetical protein